MAYEKMIRLINRLYQKTYDDEIAWETTSDEDAFQRSFPKYSVMILRRGPSAGQFFQLYDEDGRLIEEISHQDAVGQGIDVTDFFDMVRRKALGVDKALDELLEELDRPQTEKR